MNFVFSLLHLINAYIKAMSDISHRATPAESVSSNIDNRFICFIIKREAIAPSLLFGGCIMDELMIELAWKMTEKLEKFLKACRAEGDVTIDDVLKRLEELKKET